ncbi:MAG: type I-C CRISPR-associated protein Cas5c [Kiritimatiellia bacterium]
MSKGIRLHVWGENALFTRPEMKAERVSYDIMTPSAARAIVSSIYWKPQIEWVIDRIHVLKPIRFMSVRRNEVSAKAVNPKADALAGHEVNRLGIDIVEDRQQRASLILVDVAYVIEAHFNVLKATVEKGGPELSLAECEAKHISMLNRRARAGQCFRMPYFGCREFPVSFRLLEEGDAAPVCELPPEQANKDFGFMFHDFVYREEKKGPIIESNMGRHLVAEARFFRAIAKNGIIEVPDLKGEEVRA